MRRILLLAACCTTVLPSAAVHAVSFFDGVFAPVDWSLTITGSGTATAAQVLVGGDPDEYREVTTTPTPTAGSTVRAFNLHSGFVYDPGASGAVASITWSIDAQALALGQAVALALGQGGSLFFADGFVTTGQGPGWVAHGPVNLLPGDLPAGLDLSAGGAPITFGFLVANTFDTMLGEADYVGGFDNLSISVFSAPGPGRNGMAVLGLLVGSLRRRAID